MAQRVAEALAGGRLDPVICIGGDVAGLEASASSGRRPTTRARDRSAGSSPRSSGLDTGSWDTVVVSACDHPWLDGETVENLLFGLIKAPLARPPFDPDGRGPLFFAGDVARGPPGRARPSSTAGERSLRWLGTRLPVGTVHAIDPDRLRDVDTPDDLL